MRREFFEALVAFLILLLISAMTSTIPVSPQDDRYTWVDPSVLASNPYLYENHTITTQVKVIPNETLENASIHNTEEGFMIVCTASFSSLLESERVVLRGVSFIHSKGYILVNNFYILDLSNSILRSIPGIVIFSFIVLYFFKFDFRRFAFTPRGDRDS